MGFSALGLSDWD